MNRQLRDVLRDHRGLSLIRRIKAVSWWCYMDTENPLPEAEILKTMPTDETIAKLYRAVEGMQEKDQVVEQWGTAIQWTDFHTSDPFRVDYD